jgi:hypothetical protein
MDQLHISASYTCTGIEWTIPYTYIYTDDIDL